MVGVEGSARPADAANLIWTCLFRYPPGAFVNPDALPGWVFCHDRNGNQMAIALRLRSKPANLAAS